MWNVCTKPDNPTILIPITDAVPDGYTIEAQTSNPNYLIDSEFAPGTIITKLAFRNRFTTSEKITIELASIDNPNSTLEQRQQAAMLRVYLTDVNNASYVDLSRTDTRSGVQLLEAYGIIGVGRSSEILDTPPSLTEIPIR